MPSSHLDILRRHCQPLDPIPTAAEPDLKLLSDVRAVLFDVYGTLVISASGDVGTSLAQPRTAAFEQALRAVGLRLRIPDTEDITTPVQEAADLLLELIGRAHEEGRQAGIEFPEVDIREMWEQTLQRLAEHSRLLGDLDHNDVSHLALEYEVRVNPTWPMPGAAACLQELRARGLRMGIVSNAQFFTRELFPALFGLTTDALGFDPALQIYSYEWGHAKPGRFLYDRAADRLSAIGIQAEHVLYIGNDMLNDVVAARAAGFRTALFAGDARSLRWRQEDRRVAAVRPDLVLTHWPQLTDCIE